MKNPLGSAPKKETTFITVVLIVLMVMVAFDTSVEIKANYDEIELSVTSPRYSMTVANDYVTHMELLDIPELGTMVDGYEHEAYCTGTWNNDLWGEYTLCIIPTNTKCIVIQAEHSPTVVFSCTTDEQTTALYESYLAYLNQ